MKFDDIIKKVSSLEMKKVSVAAAQDEAVLEAVIEAKKRGIADAVLVGDAAKMQEIADARGFDISSFEDIDGNIKFTLNSINFNNVFAKNIISIISTTPPILFFK